MGRVLNIVETAYRGTLEEQDDTVIWLSTMLKNNGLEMSLLLRGNAVNYAVKGQDASGLAFGALKQVHPPEIDKDIEKLVSKDVPVYVVKEDADDRGLAASEFVSGIKAIPRARISGLVVDHDQVWHW